MKTLIPFLTLLLIIITTSFAQESWERITPLPQEQTLNSVTTIPGTNTIVTVGEGSTVMISNDNAESWEIIHNPAEMTNAYKVFDVHFINPTTGFICGDKESVLKTGNAGYTWYEVKMGTGGNNAYFRDFTFINDSVAYATANGGRLFISEDFGESWQLDDASFSNSLGCFVIMDDDTYVISSIDRYVYITEDGGNEWTTVDVDPDKDFISILDMDRLNDSVLLISADVNVNNNGNHIIYRSTDGGQSWDEASSVWKSGFLSNIHFFDELHGIVMVCTNIEYVAFGMETFDGGLTWEQVESGLLYTYYRDSEIISDTSLIAVGIHGAIHISHDAAHSWGKRFHSTLPGNVYDAQFVNDSIGYCYTNFPGGGVLTFHVYKTIDAGITWSCAGADPSSDNTNLFFCNPDTGYVISSIFGETVQIDRTFDGGDSWNYSYRSLETDVIYAICFVNAQSGYIACHNGLFKTSTYGDTWMRIDALDYHFYDLVICPGNEIYALATQYGSDEILIHSIDGGITWEESIINTPVGGNLCFLDNGRMVIQYKYDLYFSDDEGETWIQAIFHTNNVITRKDICFPDVSTGYMVGSGIADNFLKSTDGGETWFSCPTGVISGLSQLYFYDENHGIVMGENGIVLRTNNGGTTFIEEQPATPQQPAAISLFPNPATNILNITFEAPQQSGELIIYNANGVEIHRRTHHPNVAGIIMNIDGMPAGAYVVQYVVDGMVRTSEKIVIAR